MAKAWDKALSEAQKVAQTFGRGLKGGNASANVPGRIAERGPAHGFVESHPTQKPIFQAVRKGSEAKQRPSQGLQIGIRLSACSRSPTSVTVQMSASSAGDPSVRHRFLTRPFPALEESGQRFTEAFWHKQASLRVSLDHVLVLLYWQPGELGTFCDSVCKAAAALRLPNQAPATALSRLTQNVVDGSTADALPSSKTCFLGQNEESAT